jgi:ABC-type Fe3+/spermidine/putrescine transport system ATPase subunit
MISLKNVGVKFDHWVLRNVDLDVEPGSVLGIIGHSGIGKTTLLKSIAGLIDINEGNIWHKDSEIVGPSIKLIPGYENIQIVNQDFGLDPYHTVEENVREKVLFLPKQDQGDLISELLALVGLDQIKTRKANLLSGGEQQRLSIARALACEPEVLLLDEPFVHLDQRMKLDVIEYLRELQRLRGMTTIIVSHDGAELMGLVDEVIHMKDGSIERRASVKEMYYSPESIEQGELMGPINNSVIKGKQVLFRPNEFVRDDENGIQLKFVDTIDTGQVVYSYFEDAVGKRIILTSNQSLENLKGIRIEKRGKH